MYASETWAVRLEEEQRMERNENVMLRWMCEDTFRDMVPMVELRRRLGIEGVVDVMRRDRLRWFGHVERKEVDDRVSFFQRKSNNCQFAQYTIFIVIDGRSMLRDASATDSCR